MNTSTSEFREHVFLIKEDCSEEFPNRFKNEIFHAKNCLPKSFDKDEVKYTSNISMKCVYTGSETYIINNKVHNVKSGQVLFVNEGSDVELLYSEGNTTSVFLNQSLIMECAYAINSSFEHEEVSTSSFQFFDEPMLLQDSLWKLKSTIEFNPEALIPQDFYYELGGSILSCHDKTAFELNHIESMKSSTRLELYKRLNRAKLYLHDTLFMKFDLDQLSKEASMSKFHLIRIFKQVHGLTPHRYFINEKFKIAKDMILSTDVSIKELAFKLGYPDSSAFGKQYRQIFGISPNEHRF